MNPHVADNGDEQIPAVLQVSFFVILGFWYLVPPAADLLVEDELARTIDAVVAFSFWPLVMVYFILILLCRKHLSSMRAYGYGGTLTVIGFLKPFLMMGVYGTVGLMTYSPPQTTTGVVRAIDVRGSSSQSSSSTFTAFIEFEYRVGDEVFVKTQPLYDSWASSYEKAEQLANTAIKNGKITVYYEPNDPQSCSLNPEWSPLAGSLVLLTFGYVALGGIAFQIVKYRLLPLDLERIARSSKSTRWELAAFVTALLASLVTYARTTNLAAAFVAVVIFAFFVARNGWLYHCLFVVSAALFVFASLLHIGSIVHITPFGIADLFWLHLLIFVLAIPWLFSQLKDKGSTPSRHRSTSLWSAVPGWMSSVAGVLFIYTLFNFFFCTFYLLGGKSVGVIEGKKVLHDHGRVVRLLDDDEFEKLQDYEFRAFSGHWMLFYAAGAAAFSSAIKKNALP